MSVQGVGAVLEKSANPEDLKMYLNLWMLSGQVLFAPFKGFWVAGQPDYARNILNELLANGLHEIRAVSEH